jgi:uncharacterized protein
MAKGLRFEWDPRKALSNKTKHGVSFEEAADVFGDVVAITIADPDHGADETREVTIGQTGKLRIVVVSHTQRDGTIRIISARKADRSEILQYNEGE